MAHTLAADDGTGDLHSTFFADNILVAYAPVFPAVTFVVLFGTEYLFVEKSAALGPPRPVVYGLGFGDFSKGPFLYLLRRCEAYRYLIKFSCV